MPNRTTASSLDMAASGIALVGNDREKAVAGDNIRRKLAGWGRYPVLECRITEPRTEAEAVALGLTCAIPRGNGRSYGDASLAPDGTVLTGGLNRMLAFDSETGQLTCEAGTLLADIVETFLPLGWFVPVTPGTQFVTVGGMIASDVHGKNHHKAKTFGNYVTEIRLAIGEGQVLVCSRTQNTDLFAATSGGMGLTGVILSATFTMIQVETAFIAQTVQRAANLDEVFHLFAAAEATTYCVAWIDCLARGRDLGRSMLFLGEHAKLDQLEPECRGAPFRLPQQSPRRVPVDVPSIVLNRYSVLVFNALYYRRQKAGEHLVSLRPYFYPLDAIGDWNRIYGRRGFVQYQCVLPLEASSDGLRALLTEAAQAGTGSFLAVLKRMGPESFGLLSFPHDGYTLTLDFPVGSATMRLFKRFDAIVAAHRGRLYLSKDALMPRYLVESGYPRLPLFREIRCRYGLDNRFRSAQSTRLGL